jgi:MFS family permease
LRLGVTIALGLALFTNYAANTLLSTTLPQISSEFALSPFLSGLLSSIFGWSYAIMQVPVGIMADRYDSKRLTVLAVSIILMGVLLFAFSPNTTLLVFSRFIMGIGASFIYVVGLKTIIVYYAPKETGRSIGIFNAFGLGSISLVSAIAPLALGPTLGSWRTLYLALVPLSVLTILICAVILPGRISATALSMESTVSRKRVGQAVKSISRHGTFWVQNAINFLYFGTYFGLVFWLPTRFSQTALGLTFGGFAVSMLGLGAVLGFALYGWLTDRAEWMLVQRVSLVADALLIAAVVLAPPTAGSALLLLGASFAVGVIQGGQTVTIRIIGEIFDSTLVGTAYGIYNSITWLGLAFFPTLTGLLLSSGANFETAFAPLPILMVLAIGLSISSKGLSRNSRSSPAAP